MSGQRIGQLSDSWQITSHDSFRTGFSRLLLYTLLASRKPAFLDQPQESDPYFGRFRPIFRIIHGLSLPRMVRSDHGSI